MGTTHGSARTGQRTSDNGPGSGRRPGNRLRGNRRLASGLAGLAGLALGVGGLAACTGGSPDASSGGGTVTVTSTTTPPRDLATPSTPATTSSTSSSPSAPGGSITASTTASTPAAGGAEVPSTPAAGALASCAPGQMRVTVMGAPGGGSAGHQELQVIATNTGPTQCTIQGYPGVSLTAPGTGAQLGAAADRVPGEAPLMRLEPGKTAVSSILLAQAGAYGSSCGSVAAAGFRIYLPGQTAAAFAPFAVTACRTASVHLLSVKPFTT